MKVRKQIWTLRVRDKAIENSGDAEFIDFIFAKDASMDQGHYERGEGLPGAGAETISYVLSRGV